MLRDYLKVEKEDQLVEQQSRHDNSQHYSSVTEWVILSKDGQRKGRVSLFDRFHHPPLLERQFPHYAVR